ncbi:MAG: glycosyltransferase involved in cell wall biosynthesis [Planctomycetota bacterium]|jgi:glycosyltransferase involved in cell wall biosynthesis
MTQAQSTSKFDGVICFGGEDWWYHNRAHYDLQMMRELSYRLPVLYVNSIGMRVPTVREGGMFFKRVQRKLKSFSRGLVRVREGLSVQSPIVVPGRRGMKLSGWLLPRQVSHAARKLAMRNPLIWVACPSGIQAALQMNRAGIIYQRTDRFECYEGVDHDLIRSFDQTLKREADLVLYCSRHLFDAESPAGHSSAFIDHGVDFDYFVRAGDHPGARGAAAPQLVRDSLEGVDGPRVGFVGDVDSAVFDADLLLETAALLPDVQFVLVGGCTLPKGWTAHAPNVHLTGRVPYKDVAATMASMDVLMMPWHRSKWIEACNPIKLKEYLATGRPIVSSDFAELRHYEGLLQVANEPASFAEAIRSAIEAPDLAVLAKGRERIAGATWTSRADSVLAELECRAGLTAVGAQEPTASVSTRPSRRTLRRRSSTPA